MMLEGKVILIVDDDLTLLDMYVHRFREEGAIVETAKDGEEAIEQAENNHPNIILLDLLMPKINGFEVLKVLKENSETKDIPIIVLTVLLESDKYEKAKALGADDYIIKSDVMPADVVKKVNDLLAATEAKAAEEKETA